MRAAKGLRVPGDLLSGGLLATLLLLGAALAAVGVLLDISLLAGWRSGIRSFSHSLPLAPLVWTPVMTMCIVYVVRRWAPWSAGSGIPQVRIYIGNQGMIPSRGLPIPLAPLHKLLLNGAAIGAGLEVGVMGPATQIGAGFAASFGALKQVKAIVSARLLAITGAAIAFALTSGSALAGLALVVEGLRATSVKRRMLLFFGLLAGGIVYQVVTKGRAALPVSAVQAVFLWGLAVACGIMFSRWLLVLLSVNPKWAGLLWARRRPVAAAGLFGFTVAVLQVIGPESSVAAPFYASWPVTLQSVAHSVLLFFRALFSLASGVPGGIFTPSIHFGESLAAILSPGLDAALLRPLAAVAIIAFMSAVTQCPAMALFVSLAALGLPFGHPAHIVAAFAAAEIAALCGPRMFDVLALQWFRHRLGA